MPDIVHTVIISAAPEMIYKALTVGDLMTAWWAPQVTAEPVAGSMVEARFRGGEHIIRMEVSGLEPARKVSWVPRAGAPEWLGTLVTWEITPEPQGVRVEFRQGSFNAPAAGGSLPGSDGWAFYLASLKDYLETGQGRPDGLVTRR